MEIKQYATIKTNPEVPLKCRSFSDLTWFEAGIRQFQGDECHKYYEAVMLDPALKVTPTVVLSEMVADFILHPSGKLGSAIADFSNNILGKLYFVVVNLCNSHNYMMANTLVKVRNTRRCVILIVDVKYSFAIFIL